jgi:hypothetical protein
LGAKNKKYAEKCKYTLATKCSKKGKNKKQKNWDLSKFRPLKRFFHFSFFGEHFVAKANKDSLNQHKILDFFYTQYNTFQEKQFFTSQRGHFSNF